MAQQVQELGVIRQLQSSLTLAAAANSCSVDILGPTATSQAFVLLAAWASFNGPGVVGQRGIPTTNAVDANFNSGLGIVPGAQSPINDPLDAGPGPGVALAGYDIAGRGIILPSKGWVISAAAFHPSFAAYIYSGHDAVVIPYNYNLRGFFGTQNFDGGTATYPQTGVLTISALVRVVTICCEP